MRSALAHLWFALNFFLAIPALVLYASGAGLRPLPGALAVLGGAVIALAHLALLFLIADFVRVGRGTQLPLDPPRELVARGLYRWIRNPMYLLYAVIVLGEAILYRSPPLLVYAGAFWLMTHIYVVQVEEKSLKRRFGQAYADYCRQSGRWLPRWKP
ncbi:MAG TPA: isoprenylcysteine carboxylmethyltransferase family protein [Myxococcota bacterium]